MERKNFFRKLAQAGAGICWCSAVLGQDLVNNPGSLKENNSSPSPDWLSDLEQRMKKGAESPAWRKVEFAEEWLVRLLENMDNLLSWEERRELMCACGRSCFIHAFGAASEETPSPDALDKFILTYQQRGETDIRREGNTVYFQYGSNE